MDVFLPYSRLIDRMTYEYKISRKLFWITGHLMGWHDDGMKQFTGFHMHATAHEVKKKIGEKLFNSYFKFTFIRNPFDFLVSLYFYILQDENHRQHNAVVKMSFLDFLRWYVASSPKRQLDFLVEPGSNKILVDYIGRYETLEKDIAIIRESLGLDSSGNIGHKNPSIQRKNKDYKVYYDIEGRHIVENYFREDLDLLGYDFSRFSESIPTMRV